MTNPFARYQSSPGAAPATGTLVAPGPGGDLFGAPAPTGEKQPRIPDMDKRLILIRPIRVDEVPKAAKFGGKAGDFTSRLTADVVVLDGGTLWYGGQPEDPDEPKPHDLTTEVPYLMRRRYISQAAMVAKGRAVLESGGKLPPWILGRVYKGPKTGEQRAPWLLSDPTEADVAVARAWFAANPQDPFKS